MSAPRGNESLRGLDAAGGGWRCGSPAAVVLLYFGFIALVAYGRHILAIQIIPGLSLGILLGAIVIVGSWLLTWVYVRWANAHYDPHIAALGKEDRP